MSSAGAATTDNWERIELDAARSEHTDESVGRPLLYYSAVACWVGVAFTDARFALHTLLEAIAAALSVAAIAWSVVARSRAPRTTAFIDVVRGRPGDVRWAYVTRREVRGARSRLVTHRMALHLADGTLVTSAGWDVLSPEAFAPVFARLPNARVGDRPEHRAAYEAERAGRT